MSIYTDTYTYYLATKPHSTLCVGRHWDCLNHRSLQSAGNMVDKWIQCMSQFIFHRGVVPFICLKGWHCVLDVEYTVYPKRYAHGFCFAVLCCGYTLTDFPISIRLTSLALWQSNDCPSASKATLMNMDKYFMWIHYERLHNHNKAKHNKTVCIFLGIYCTMLPGMSGRPLIAFR